MILWQPVPLNPYRAELLSVLSHRTLYAFELRLIAAWLAFWAAQRLRRENATGMRRRATFGRRTNDHLVTASR